MCVCVCVCVRACVCVLFMRILLLRMVLLTTKAMIFKKNNHKLYLTRDIELIIKYRVIWIPSVLTVFSLRTFTCDVQ